VQQRLPSLLEHPIAFGHRGARAHAPENTLAGFELALKKRYDLFIFDFQMPMIDGAMLFFLIGKVYNNLQPPRIVPPLLLVSGKADEERAQELLKEPGVRGLVAKPFSMNRLLQKAQECVPGIESLETPPTK